MYCVEDKRWQERGVQVNSLKLPLAFASETDIVILAVQVHTQMYDQHLEYEYVNILLK